MSPHAPACPSAIAVALGASGGGRRIAALAIDVLDMVHSRRCVIDHLEVEALAGLRSANRLKPRLPEDELSSRVEPCLSGMTGAFKHQVVHHQIDRR